MKTNTSFPWIQTTTVTSVLAAVLVFASAPTRAACVYDGTFATDGIGANDTVYAVAAQANGKLVLGGSFTHINGSPRPRFAILNTDGTLDPYFYNNPNNTIRAIVIQPDTKILIGGDFTTVYGGSKPYLARILAAYGTTDSLVVPTLNSSVHAIALQPDGKILIGGSFSSPKPGIARLNSDGSVDTSFNPGTGTENGTVYAIAVNNFPSSPNWGKIYIVGNFFRYAGVDRVRIARLNSNGSLDTTFSAPVPNHNVYAVAVQYTDSEKIVIGGAWTHDSNFTSDRFSRLNASGSPDHAFNFTFNSVDADVRSVVLQSDGKILIGGAFALVGGMERRGVARFHPNGGLDDWSDCGGVTSPASTVLSIAVQPSGYMYTGGVIIGGYFTQFESNTHWNYARFNF